MCKGVVSAVLTPGRSEPQDGRQDQHMLSLGFAQVNLVVLACVPQIQGRQWAQEPISEYAQQRGHGALQTKLRLQRAWWSEWGRLSGAIEQSVAKQGNGIDAAPRAAPVIFASGLWFAGMLVSGCSDVCAGSLRFLSVRHALYSFTKPVLSLSGTSTIEFGGCRALAWCCVCVSGSSL